MVEGHRNSIQLIDFSCMRGHRFGGGLSFESVVYAIGDAEEKLAG